MDIRSYLSKVSERLYDETPKTRSFLRSNCDNSLFCFNDIIIYKKQDTTSLIFRLR